MKAKYKYIYNRKGKLKADGTALVQLQIYINPKQKYYSTGINLKPTQWDDKNKIIKNHPNQIRLNKQLRDKISSLEDYELKILEGNKAFSFNCVDSFLTGSTNVDFIDFCRQHLENDRTKKYGSYCAINSKLNIIEQFGKLQSFSDLTYENIEKLDNWLRSEGKQVATVFKYHKTLKYFITQAVKRDLFSVNNNPYLKWVMKRPKSAKRRFLDVAELQRIEEKEFSTDRLRVVKDIFLFSVYTGMSYADIADLKNEDIYTDPEGYEWLIRDRVKTGSEYKVPLLPQAAKILDRYKGSKTPLPIRANQKMNEYLKEIADLCGIDKNLTFHMARHTFATTITLSNDVPIETVSKMLGHSDLKTTQVYAKIVDEKMKNDMQTLRKKLEK